MRFDPQANAVPETKPTLMSPIPAEAPVMGVRSPLKTAVVIVVIGFVLGGAMWLWSEEGGPAQSKANADTTAGSGMNESIIQYAEALINEKTEADRVKAVTGRSIESRLGGRPVAGVRAQDEYRSGKLAMGMGEHAKAAAHFEQAIRINPSFTDAHYRLGLAYVRIGDFRAARRQQAFLKQLHDDRANLIGHLVDN
jgi:tetratricopeptide (TPR) repeat protein